MDKRKIRGTRDTKTVNDCGNPSTAKAVPLPLTREALRERRIYNENTCFKRGKFFP